MTTFVKRTPTVCPMAILTKTEVTITSVLAFIFFFSGLASLIYQVVWQRILTLHYGVGAISIALIVSIYMMGLGLGGLLGGMLAERVKNKIALYFIVELLIGSFGLVSLAFLDFLGRYTAGSGYLTSLVCMFLFLCLPTLLMGITLPLLTKIFNHWVQDFLGTISYLYFINTIGAAVGAVLTGYVLISFLGLDSALYLAVAINLALAALIFGLQRFPDKEKKQPLRVEIEVDEREIFGRAAYLLVFVTGFLAIGYEIAWFRVVGVIVKDSPYVFSSVLSVYLVGIALGSFGMCKFLKRYQIADKKSLFFYLQFGIGLYVIAVFIGYYYLTKYTPLEIFTRLSFANVLHPSSRIVPNFSSAREFLIDLYSLFDVFVWPTVFVLVPTVLMGASFPLVSFLALARSDNEGKTVGTVYFFNIMGNVLGGIVTGFFLLESFGTEMTLLGFSAVNIIMFLFVSRLGRRRFQVLERMAIVAMLLISGTVLFPRSGQLYQTVHTSPGDEFKRFFEEGMDGIIMTYENHEKLINYINGVEHGTRPDTMYYFEAIEALSFAPRVENVLIIGFGTGSIAETVLKMKEVRKVTVVELSHALMRNLQKIPLFQPMLADGRLDLIIEDGRRFLLRTREKYDVILMDPLRSTTSHANNLHSRQFFELANQHLSPKGILLLGGMNEKRVLPKTVAAAFPHVRMYSYFCLASVSPFERNMEAQTRLLTSFHPQTQEAISHHHNLFLGDENYIKAVAKGYPINEQWKPVSEYYLGLTVKTMLSGLN